MGSLYAVHSVSVPANRLSLSSLYCVLLEISFFSFLLSAFQPRSNLRDLWSSLILHTAHPPSHITSFYVSIPYSVIANLFLVRSHHFETIWTHRARLKSCSNSPHFRSVSSIQVILLCSFHRARYCLCIQLYRVLSPDRTSKISFTSYSSASNSIFQLSSGSLLPISSDWQFHVTEYPVTPQVLKIFEAFKMYRGWPLTRTSRSSFS